MSKAFLLDSNIIIDVLNGEEAARDYFKSLPIRRVSAASVFEVLVGCTGKRKKQLPIARELFRVCEVVDFSLEDAERAAELFIASTRKKEKILDYFIAATAENKALEVATRNVRDFKSVKAFAPYKLD